jgi:hypothetical protein
VVVLAVAVLGGSSEARRGAPVPFAWFEPDAAMSRDDLQRLGRREVVVKALPSKNSQLGVFAVTELRQSPDVFVAWIRNMPRLQRSKAVAAIGRFSDPPVLKDLDGLTLDRRDLQSIRECDTRECDLKMSAAEIEALKRVAHGPDEAIQYTFRRLLLERLLAYQARGLAAVPVAASRPVQPADVFAALHASSPYIRRSDARLAMWLSAPDQSPGSEVESFYYWAKEYYASGKPVVVLTQVGVTRAPAGGPAPEVSVVGRQLFATRYMNGMLSHITVAREPGGDAYYMTYSNRAQLDALSGFWGGIVRTIINSRLRGDAATVLESLRGRIESGPPS